MNQRRHLLTLGGIQRHAVTRGGEPGNTAFQAAYDFKRAVLGNVSGLGGPGRERAETRHNQQQFALQRQAGAFRAIVEQALEQLLIAGGNLAVQCRKMPILRMHRDNRGKHGAQPFH